MSPTRTRTLFALLGSTLLILSACGGGDEEGGIKVEEDAGQSFLGPSAEALGASLEDIVFDHWRVVSVSRKKTANIGDEVEEVIKGRFEATVKRRADTFEPVERLGPPGRGRRPLPASRPVATSRPSRAASGGDTLIVEEVGTEGDEVKLYGLYVSKLVRDTWQTTFRFELESGQSIQETTDVARVMRVVLGDDLPLESFDAGEVIVKGSEREAVFRREYEAETERLRREAEQAAQERAARREEQRRLEAERRREANRTVFERLAEGRTYLGRAEFPGGDDEAEIVFTKLDAETGAVEGRTRRITRKKETYLRPVTGSLQRATFDLREGRDLDEGLGRYACRYSLRIAEDGTSLTGTWSDRSARGRKITFDLRPADEVRAERNRILTKLAAGRVYRGETVSGQKKKVELELEVTAVDLKEGALRGTIQWNDVAQKQVIKKAFECRTHLGSLDFIDGKKVGGNANWGKFRWMLDLGPDGKSITGRVDTGHGKRPVTISLEG